MKKFLQIWFARATITTILMGILVGLFFLIKNIILPHFTGFILFIVVLLLFLFISTIMSEPERIFYSIYWLWNKALGREVEDYNYLDW